MAKAAKKTRPVTDQADRMRRLRLALGCKTSIAFATRYGFTSTQWNNFENGSPVGLNAAMQLVRKIPGLSLDWVYYGNAGGLSVEMARRLGELPDADG